MGLTVLRRSERIRNRNMAKDNRMLRQTKREGARVPASVRCKSKNNIQRHKLRTSLFSKLPDELVVEILSRLPPKSFFRCKSVCKTWLSLSSDAVRLNKHLQPTTMSGLFFNYLGYDAGFVNLSCGINNVEVDLTINALSCHDHLEVLDCCNGLLLVGAYKKESRFAHDVHVYNPATRTLFTLWSHKLHDQPGLNYEFFSLAFDPRVLPQFHVIRFTGGYKVDGEFLDIFSYERDKCKRHIKFVSNVRMKQNSKGTFVDGRVYRLTIQHYILSIDPNNCSYQFIGPPNLENRALIEIGQSRGVLHCMSVCHEKRLFIWVLESYTRHEWILKYQRSLDKIYPVRMPDFSFFCINRIQCFGNFAFHPEKDVVFMPVGHKDLMSLDLNTANGDVLVSLSNNGKRYCWIYTPYYMV